MKNFLFIIDPIEKLHHETDTSLIIMTAAKKRGHSVWYCDVNELQLEGDIQSAVMHQFETNSSAQMRLDEMAVIFMRKDPPVNESYITATHILSLVDKKKTRVINAPEALRDFNEKLIINNFPEFIAPTLVAADSASIRNFISEHKIVVMKPVNEFAGRGIFVVHSTDSNISPFIEHMTAHGSKHCIVQKYLPEVKDGDTRVLILNGTILGSQKRVAQPGEHRSNISAGGSSHQGQLTDIEQKMCTKIGAWLKEKGIVFAGIDLIGGYCTEINITSPTGLVKMNEHDNAHYEENVVDFMEEICKQ